jgi:hypothetical protein
MDELSEQNSLARVECLQVLPLPATCTRIFAASLGERALADFGTDSTFSAHARGRRVKSIEYRLWQALARYCDYCMKRQDRLYHTATL